MPETGQSARSHYKLPPDGPFGPAAVDAPEAAEEGSSFEAAAGPDGSSAFGMEPIVMRAGVAEEVALLEDAMRPLGKPKRYRSCLRAVQMGRPIRTQHLA